MPSVETRYLACLQWIGEICRGLGLTGFLVINHLAHREDRA